MGRLLIGQTNTTFMDIDIFPNVVDHWGPTGMVFVRNPQIRWSFIDNDSMALVVALENPSDDVDPGQIRIIDPELGNNIVAREEVPDLAAHFRYRGGWGHVQVAGLLRNLAFETLGTPGNEPKDSLLGWGLNLTSVIKTGERSRFLLGLVYGEGIASYMNDGGVDLAPAGAPGDLDAEAVPLLGLSLYYDHYWNDELSTSFGYSRTEVDNTSFQAPMPIISANTPRSIFFTRRARPPTSCWAPSCCGAAVRTKTAKTAMTCASSSPANTASAPIRPIDCNSNRRKGSLPSAAKTSLAENRRSALWPRRSSSLAR